MAGDMGAHLKQSVREDWCPMHAQEHLGGGGVGEGLKRRRQQQQQQQQQQNLGVTSDR